MGRYHVPAVAFGFCDASASESTNKVSTHNVVVLVWSTNVTTVAVSSIPPKATADINQATAPQTPNSVAYTGRSN